MLRKHTLHCLPALLLALGILIYLGFPAVARCADADDTAVLFEGSENLSATAYRAPKPLSETAENVTVITSDDVKALNAHTLADVLNTVSGIQLQNNGGPGIISYTLIQSTNYNYTQVFIDGVSLSNLASNFADVSFVPAQIIDRIEIVKGPASSTWGQAMGGVINVITKSPERDRPISGSAYASIGSVTTSDTRGELSGTSDKVGYYLYGDYLGSDGLLPTLQIGSNHAYGKLTYDLPNQGKLWGTFGYFHASEGDIYAPLLNLTERSVKTTLLASIGLSYHLAQGLDLEVTGRHSEQDYNIADRDISDGLPYTPTLPTSIGQELVNGGSAKLVWRASDNLLVAGSDYNHDKLYENSADGFTVSPYDSVLDRWGIYVNDTLNFGPVSFAPGIRLDQTRTDGDQISSSFGATWKVTDSTLLRAYIGRGYGLAYLVPPNTPSVKILTEQIGVENTALPYLWLKATFFRNMTWGVGTAQQLAMGCELEARTKPVFNTSLSAGWTYTDTYLTDGDTPVPNVPRQTLQLALRYDDRTFRGMLTGRYLNWNAEPDYNAEYGGIIWDLHLGAVLLKRKTTSVEVFFSDHNMFNGSQNDASFFPNVSRWFEGGVKVTF